MQIIPAIDLQDGKVVRLTRGDYKIVKVYSDDPAGIAKKWQAQGVSLLHVVDLDGALKGEPKNMDSVTKIVKSVSIPIELGGGLRTLKAISEAFKIGVSRVVLGSKAAEDFTFIRNAIKEFGKKIVVSIDSKGGIAMLDGWTKPSSLYAVDLAKDMENLGAAALIYTDISVDGTLAGPNFKQLSNFLSNVSIPVITAGGIGTLDDIKKLSALNRKNLAGVIVGKALYEGTIDLQEAMKACSQKE